MEPVAIVPPRSRGRKSKGGGISGGLRKLADSILHNPQSPSIKADDPKRQARLEYERRNQTIYIEDESYPYSLDVFVCSGTGDVAAYVADVLPRFQKDVEKVVEENGWYVAANNVVPEESTVVHMFLLPVETAEVDVSHLSSLYHATPTNRVKSILAEGLKPSSKGRQGRNQREGAVYLASSRNYALRMIPLLTKNPNEDLSEWSVIEVDASKVVDLDFHQDHEALEPEGAYFFTREHIPASALRATPAQNPTHVAHVRQRLLRLSRKLRTPRG